MRVVLLQEIKGIGRKGEIKEISDGYVRNALLPKNLVKIATPEILKKALEENKKNEEKHNELINKINEEAVKLKNTGIIFNVKKGEKGEIFESVSRGDIQKKLEELGFFHFSVEIEKPIRALGSREIQINFGEGIKEMLKIQII